MYKIWVTWSSLFLCVWRNKILYESWYLMDTSERFTHVSFSLKRSLTMNRQNIGHGIRSVSVCRPHQRHTVLMTLISRIMDIRTLCVRATARQTPTPNITVAGRTEGRWRWLCRRCQKLCPHVCGWELWALLLDATRGRVAGRWINNVRYKTPRAVVGNFNQHDIEAPAHIHTHTKRSRQSDWRVRGCVSVYLCSLHYPMRFTVRYLCIMLCAIHMELHIVVMSMRNYQKCALCFQPLKASELGLYMLR